MAFYREKLGLEESITGMSGACFFAAGGYHHHIGCNVWTSAGAPPPPHDALGLHFFTLTVPKQTHVMRLVARLKAAGIEVVPYAQSYLLRDPSHHRIVLTAEVQQDSQQALTLANLPG